MIKPPPTPTIRAIVLGILLFVLILGLVGNLGEIVKGTGYLLYYPLGKLGLLKQVTSNEVFAVDMSVARQTLVFKTAGNYAFYTSNLDLLMITDAISEGDGKPWLKLTCADDGKAVEVDFVHRGLMIYDTPLAKGRPIFVMSIPQPGTYVMQNATQPGALGYFVRDYVSGQEKSLTIYIIVEILLLISPFGIYEYRHLRKKSNLIKVHQQQNRLRADNLWRTLK
ncbi:MAG: EGFR-like transmembrane domain-containing protein, partial [Anaerolineales bacterium]